MKSIKYLPGILLLIAFAAFQVQAKREFKIEILDFKGNITRKELFSDSIYTSFNKQQVSVEFTVAQNVMDWSATFSVDILPPGKPSSHVFKLNANICDCLKSTCRNTFVVTLFKEIFRTSNFPLKCPLLANKKYFLRNYTTRAGDYPSYLPMVTWQVHIEMMFNRKPAMMWFIKGRTGKF